MRDLSTLEYHPIAEKLVKVLCQKTQNTNDLFYHVLVAYYLSKVASMMRVSIKTHDRGVIPINMYAINLAPSGQGKGFSTNIVEDSVINQFRDRFTEETFPAIAEKNLAKLAIKRANKKNVSIEEEEERIRKEFQGFGPLLFSFDSGTTAAVKQMRNKLLFSKAGAISMEIDEIGSNLLGNVDVLNTFLELFDVGKVKQKLVKNTAENVRVEEVEGKTPANMMLFGTPVKLLNGGKVEEEFFSFIETGYGRRCFFGYSRSATNGSSLTADEVYDMLTDTTADSFLLDISTKLGKLANSLNFGKELTMSKEVSIISIQYQQMCEAYANKLPEFEEIRKAEMAHRYFKAMKLAGAYAFVDGSHEITKEHFYNAVKLAEDSGRAFTGLLTRERNYVKLARYIAEVGREITHVDMVEDLPFYKGSEMQKRELMTLAIAYGYKNNIIIKKMFNDGIEFLVGESLKETNTSKMIISYSTELAANYKNEEVPFDKLHVLTQTPNYHWVAHHLIEGYRKEENALPGFNLVVLDIDSGVSMSTVKLLMKDYKSLIYTTKRHSDINNRFRVILPMTHTLKMDASDYKEFMDNVYEWLPFEVDKQTNQRARKWMSHSSTYAYNDGELLDSLLFIPKTTKNEARKVIIDSQQSLSNIERWFICNTGLGNRSNQMIKYAYMLVDSGMDIDNIRNNILALNNKIADKMDETEILGTILVSASKAIHKRDIA